MTRYTVVWHAAVRDKLGHAWIRTTDRQAIADAADRIDLELAIDADSKGEDFYGDRYLEVYPLAVVFEVDAGNRIVRVNELFFAPGHAEDVADEGA